MRKYRSIEWLLPLPLLSHVFIIVHSVLGMEWAQTKKNAVFCRIIAVLFPTTFVNIKPATLMDGKSRISQAILVGFV